jgi:hypothetical protein
MQYPSAALHSESVHHRAQEENPQNIGPNVLKAIPLELHLVAEIDVVSPG